MSTFTVDFNLSILAHRCLFRICFAQCCRWIYNFRTKLSLKSAARKYCCICFHETIDLVIECRESSWVQTFQICPNCYLDPFWHYTLSQADKIQRAPELAGNRIPVNCLEGSYAHHNSTNGWWKENQLFLQQHANSENFSVVYLLPCWSLTEVRFISLWLVGLGVWFSLRVREVPGSNPGRALYNVSQLFVCCWCLTFLVFAIVSTLRKSVKCPHTLTCINPLNTCLAPFEIPVWAFLSPQWTCYIFKNFHGLDFFFCLHNHHFQPLFSMKNIMNAVRNISCSSPQTFWTIHTFDCIGSIYLCNCASKRNKFLEGLFALVLFR